MQVCRRDFVALVAGVLTVVGAVVWSPVSAQDDSVETEMESIRQELEAESGDGAAEKRDGGEVEDESRDEEVGADAGGEVTLEEGARRSAGSESGSAEVFSAWSLYRDPVLSALFAGVILGLLGVYVVARRIVFVSAALSQVSALGITVGFLCVAAGGLSGMVASSIPPVFAVLLSFALVALLTGWGEEQHVPRDSVLGTAFVIPMALVLVLGPHVPQEMHDIETVLHGSAVVASPSDVWMIGVAGAVVLVTQVVFFRAFVFSSLDPTVARTREVPVTLLDGMLFGSVALMTGLVTQVLGALPTFALTVLPALGAIRLNVGLRTVFVVAAVLGGVAGVGGYGLAYYLDWSVGASQTLVAGAGASIGWLYERMVG